MITPVPQFPLADWLRTVTVSALANASTIPATYRFAADVLERKIPGDLVECGVFAGAQSAVMARAVMDAAQWNRRVHLFDSFTGIPQAGPEDVEFVAVGHPAGLSACAADLVKGNMAGWGIPENMLVYHEGLFEDTVPQHGISQIAMLRLDGDLYRSTKVCLEHLVRLVSPGGWIVVDDFDLSGARQALMECAGEIQFGPIYWMKQP